MVGLRKKNPVLDLTSRAFAEDQRDNRTERRGNRSVGKTDLLHGGVLRKEGCSCPRGHLRGVEMDGCNRSSAPKATTKRKRRRSQKAREIIKNP